MAEAITSPRTILVVGDLPDVRDLLQYIVAHAAPNYESLASDNPQYTLDLLAERAVALVFVHVRLQDMAGLPIATTIKTRSPAPRVVLVSAMDVDALKRHTQVLRLNGYLTKPFSLADVAQILNTLLP